MGYESVDRQPWYQFFSPIDIYVLASYPRPTLIGGVHEARELPARRPAELRRGRGPRRHRPGPPDRRQVRRSPRAHHGERARGGEARRGGPEARRELRLAHPPAGDTQSRQDRVRRPELRGAPRRDEPRQDREPGALPARPRLAGRAPPADAEAARVE